MLCCKSYPVCEIILFYILEHIKVYKNVCEHAIMAEKSGADRELMTSSKHIGDVNDVSVKVREFDFIHGVKVSAVAMFVCPITHKQASLDNVILYHAGNVSLPDSKVLKKVGRAVNDYVRYARQADKDGRTSNAMNSEFFRNEYRFGRRN